MIIKGAICHNRVYGIHLQHCNREYKENIQLSLILLNLLSIFVIRPNCLNTSVPTVYLRVRLRSLLDRTYSVCPWLHWLPTAFPTGMQMVIDA